MVVTDLKYSSRDKYKAKVAVYDNGKKLATSQYTIGAVTDLVYEKDETGADTKCGTAKAVISGKKNYTGTKEVTVVIKEALLSSVKAKVDGTFFYENGKEIRPTELTVTIGSGKKKQTLTQGVDYIIVEDGYKNNVKAGRATLTIQGIGKYGGTKEVKFTILSRWLKLN